MQDGRNACLLRAKRCRQSEVYVPRTFTPKQVEAAKARLSSLPERPAQQKPLNLAESIREMKTEIQAALKRGYTLEEIAQSLKDDQFDVGVPTLRAYLSRKNRPATTGANKRGTRRKSGLAQSTARVQPQPEAKIVTKPERDRTSASRAIAMPSAEEL